jgi:hypothetical protein
VAAKEHNVTFMTPSTTRGAAGRQDQKRPAN